jgi:hypothetical protein
LIFCKRASGKGVSLLLTCYCIFFGLLKVVDIFAVITFVIFTQQSTTFNKPKVPTSLSFLFSAVLLLLTLVQDVRARAVSVLVFPALLLCLALLALVHRPLPAVLEAWGLNMLFLAAQIGLLYIYFLVTKRRMVAVVGSAMGLGDVLFWLVAAVLFPLPAFILFFLASLLFSLALHFLLRLSFRNSYSRTVPLAGFQALTLLLLLLGGQLYPEFNFHDDASVLEALTW